MCSGSGPCQQQVMEEEKMAKIDRPFIWIRTLTIATPPLKKRVGGRVG